VQIRFARYFHKAHLRLLNHAYCIQQTLASCSCRHLHFKKRSRRPNCESKRRATLSSSNVPDILAKSAFRSNEVGPLLSKCQREKKQEWRRRIEFYVARASEGGDKKMALLLHGVASRLTTLPAFLHGCHCFCTNKQWPNYECRRGQPGKQTCHATRVTPFL
jgi:hypothetical protein